MKKLDLVCIIDDDPIYVFGAKRVMEYTDFCSNFMIFTNGQEALDTLGPLIKSGGHFPAVILLDINMPVLDGWGFLDELSKVPHAKELTIFIVSSSINEDDRAKAQSYELVTSFIVKPLTKSSLQEMARQITSSTD